MSRGLLPAMAAQLGLAWIAPIFMVAIQFRSKTSYAWSGVGSFVYGGNTYLGVGSLGELGPLVEGSEVRADGTSLGLSGIDPDWLSECLTDIQIGAPAKRWFALLGSDGNVIGTPYLQFSGTVDAPTIQVGVDAVSISLALETRFSDMHRTSGKRYTAADQHILYPLDTGFNHVEELNDKAVKWGTA